MASAITPIINYPAEINSVASMGGRYWGWSHWKQIAYGNKAHDLHADTSVTITLTDGRKVHPLYYKKGTPCFETGIISFFCLLSTPFYITAAVIYHLFRFAMMIPTQLYTAIEQGIRAESGQGLKAFWGEIKVIPSEMFVSLKVLITTPIAGGLWVLGHLVILATPSLYIWGDNLNGRKIVRAAELIWGRFIPLQEGYWSTHGQMGSFVNRRGAEPLYFAGCMQVTGFYDQSKEEVTFFGDRTAVRLYNVKYVFDWRPCCFAPATIWSDKRPNDPHLEQ